MDRIDAVERLTAFSNDPMGGNPAGVVLADGPLDAAAMLAAAAEVGYSETAFAWPDPRTAGPGAWEIRYFSPVAEVAFCGHATIATGALLAEREGPGVHRLATRGGEVLVEVGLEAGTPWAALTSVAPEQRPLPDGLLAAVLRCFGWTEAHLDPHHAPTLAYAGAWHLLLPVRSRQVLAEMTYDFEGLLARMTAEDLTTVDVLWQRDATTWHARNPFPIGGVVEDPATGAAAAAFGGWLRAAGHVDTPADVVVLQGEDMGRPSRIEVHVPAAGGIRVRGRAARIV